MLQCIILLDNTRHAALLFNQLIQRGAVGITIVQKSDLRVRKRDPKIALVLAGGAITGGAFKVGGLKALDDFLVNRKTTELDSYVGLSAGAVLAGALAAGISPAEMIKSLDGRSDELTAFQAYEFYSPNIREFIERERQREIEAREHKIFRKHRHRLARQARALIAEQARP